MDAQLEEKLNQARLEGDPLADNVVAQLLADGRFPQIEDLMHGLVENNEALPPGLPDYLADFLVQTATPPLRPNDVEEGERFFALHGPELCLILGCYSLPASYAASKGVQVLHQTAYLARRPNRRVAETGQMIIDVMTPGGLGPNGRGIRSAQKVRLYHAAVRHRILAKGWNTAELGIPINQEDMLGTLMVFAYLGLNGLQRMGVQATPREEQAYLDAWRCVGSIMGIRLDLIPESVEKARQVTQFIQDRQIAPSSAGTEMTRALLEMFEKNFPVWGGRAIGASMMRTFLPDYAADYLEIPRHRLLDFAMRRLLREVGTADTVLKAGPVRSAVFRFLSIALLRWFDNIDLSGKRTDFRIPSHLRTRWQADQDPSFWKILWHQIRMGTLP